MEPDDLTPEMIHAAASVFVEMEKLLFARYRFEHRSDKTTLVHIETNEDVASFSANATLTDIITAVHVDNVSKTLSGLR